MNPTSGAGNLLNRTGRWWNGISWRRRATLIGVIALAPRVLSLFVIGLRTPTLDDTISYDAFARLMMSGWQWFTTPLTVREPLYPAFMALAYALPGNDLITLLVLQVIVEAAACVLVYATLRTLSESVAVIAALFMAFNPEFIGFAALPLRETLITSMVAAFLMTFLLFMRKPGVRRAFICALFFVLLAHTDVRFLPLIVCVPLMALAYMRQLRACVRPVLWFALFVVLLMIPYQIRGYAATGHAVIITDRFLGKWLSRATAQVSAGEDRQAEASGGKRAVWLENWIEKKTAHLEEVTAQERAYFLSGGRPAVARPAVHWFLFREYWRFARFAPEYRPYPDGRFADPWSLRHNLSSSLAIVPFFLLLPFVFLRPSRAMTQVAWPLLIFLGAHAAMHVIVHARARYRIPMEVVTSILMAIAIVNLLEYLRRRRTPPQTT